MKALTLLTALMTVSTLSTTAWSDEDYKTTEELDNVVGEDIEVSETKRVHTTVWPLVKHRNDGEKKSVKMLYVPFVSVVKASETEEKTRTDLVTVPFFKLVKSEHNADGRFDNQFIKLPIVGSVFRHRRTDDKEKVRFLFFSHTKRLDPDAEVTERPEGRPHSQSRGKGFSRNR